MGTILMRETYAPVILAHKAKKLRKSTGIEYQSQHDIDHASLTKMLADNLLRPLRMLVTRPILLILSVHVAIVYGYLYLVFTTLTYAYTNLYNFTPGEAGLTFLGIGVGMLIGEFSLFTLAASMF